MKIKGEPITDQTLRKMRGLFASGVTVVTTVHEDQLRGVTVRAFSSVSLNPPLVLVCLANESESKDWIAESGVFAVNILSDEQEFLWSALPPVRRSSCTTARWPRTVAFDLRQPHRRRHRRHGCRPREHLGRDDHGQRERGRDGL